MLYALEAPCWVKLFQFITLSFDPHMLIVAPILAALHSFHVSNDCC